MDVDGGQEGDYRYDKKDEEDNESEADDEYGRDDNAKGGG